MNTVEQGLTESGFSFVSKDLNRPWGAFWVIKEQDAFLQKYFPDQISILGQDTMISPKILYVAPGKRLSWQYHHRRKEVWRVVDGPVGVIRSRTDEPGPLDTHDQGDLIILEKEERHRLIGLDQPGLVAEIWVHIDPSNPSDEDDIIRIRDDFSRS